MEDRSVPTGILAKCVNGFVSSTVSMIECGLLDFSVKPAAIISAVHNRLAVTTTKARFSLVIVILLIFLSSVGLLGHLHLHFEPEWACGRGFGPPRPQTHRIHNQR